MGFARKLLVNYRCKCCICNADNDGEIALCGEY